MHAQELHAGTGTLLTLGMNAWLVLYNLPVPQSVLTKIANHLAHYDYSASQVYNPFFCLLKGVCVLLWQCL